MEQNSPSGYDLLEKIVKAIPLFTVILIILGIFSMGIFYSSLMQKYLATQIRLKYYFPFIDLIITLIIIFVITFPTYLILNSIKSAGTIFVIRPRTNEETEFDYEVFQRHELKRSKRKTWKGFGIYSGKSSFYFLHITHFPGLFEKTISQVHRSELTIYNAAEKLGAGQIFPAAVGVARVPLHVSSTNNRSHREGKLLFSHY